MNIALWLQRAAVARGSAPALLRGTDTVADYSVFRDRAAALAQALVERGMGPGVRVAIFAKNCPDYLIALFGIWWAGAVAVPVNARLHPRELEFIVTDSGAALVLSDRDGLDLPMPVVRLDGPGFAAMSDPAGAGPAPQPHRASADDLAWLFYTSGTTGRPKGVCITHGMLTAVSLAYLADVDPGAAESGALYAGPMSHGAGIYAPVHVLVGQRHICPPAGSYDPGAVLDLAASCGPVSMFLAPTMVQRLLAEAQAQGRRGNGIRTIVYGGGPMYLADIVAAVDWFGPVFVQIYGQGECPMAITCLPRDRVADRSPGWEKRVGSVGRAQSLVDVAVADADGRPLPAGSVGEIMVRGLPVMPGYWRNPEASARALRDGWLMTGDVGRLDPEGWLTLLDRSKDLIISGGSNIYPREVEEVLITHPSVAEVSVVGAPSAEWGEEVVAFVVPAPGAALDPDALDRHCLARIARFKRPKRYLELAELPKNNYGKVLKTALRAQLSDGRSS
ncbi:MAG: class I adenylate-forming enzyme family protein [Gemmobacter sp.]